MKLQQFWADEGCVIQQPYDVEVGAGTMHPETFFRVLGPDPYRVAYTQPSRRPADGRYGANPNRLEKHMQFQVVLKPPPASVQEIFLKSLRLLGINLKDHDVKFEEDNWESPTLGAWGMGWQVMLDGKKFSYKLENNTGTRINKDAKAPSSRNQTNIRRPPIRHAAPVGTYVNSTHAPNFALSDMVRLRAAMDWAAPHESSLMKSHEVRGGI